MTDNLVPFRRSERRELSDAQLLAACAGGDRGALEELFRRHGEQVRRIVIRLRYVDKQDLDDVVQTTFLEVYRAARSFGGRAAVGTWILGIAMNVVRHYVRAEARRRSALSVVGQSPSRNQPPHPDEEVARKQAMSRLQAGFDALPENLRVVFTLCDLEGMKSIEVARVLEVAEGTVWRRLHYARLRLRVFLDGYVGR